MNDKPHVTTIENADKWTVDNRYLYHGYRRNFNNFRQTMRSCFMPHNEVMNIWTHLIGALVLLVCLFCVFSHMNKSQAIYNGLQQKFNQSEFLKDVYSHSQSVSNYMRTLKLEVNLQPLHQYISDLKIDYTQKYEKIKTLLIEEEELIYRNIHQKLDKTRHVLEDAFEKLSNRLHAVKGGSNFDFENWNDQIEKMLNVDVLVIFIDNIFKRDLEFYPIIIYIISAMTCLSLSAAFHSFYVMNPTICKILQKCDYAGIIILIFGSSFALNFYNLYCFPLLRHVYNSSLAVFSVICFITSLSDYVDREEGKKFLSYMMAGLGLLNIVPIAHTFILKMSPESNQDMFNVKDLLYFPVTGVIYLSGLAVYVSRFPEKYYPKKFDIWLNSHTIWHIFVFLGTISHYVSLMKLYQVRLGMICSV